MSGKQHSIKFSEIVVDDEKRTAQHELMLYQKSCYLPVGTPPYLLVILELRFLMWMLLNLILKYQIKFLIAFTDEKLCIIAENV